MDPFYDWVIQPSDRHINLIDTIKLILDFNEEPNQIWFENVKIKNEPVIIIGENSQKLLIPLCN